MNPAFNRTLSLLVEIKTNHPTPDFDRSRGRERRVQAGNNNVTQKILGKAKPSHSLSTNPKQDPNDDTPADQVIPPRLNKAETFYDRLRATLAKHADAFRAKADSVRSRLKKLSAKVIRKK